MQLWVGLGNPGGDYASHRHNVGFMVMDALATDHGFAPWRTRFRGLACEGRIGGQRLILLKPMTFMNESGRSIGEAARFFKLDPEAVTVFHDELDLDPFRVKVKQGGGTAGHNGLRSTESHFGREVRRVRIGIGHPGHKDRVTGHVLGAFAKSEQVDLRAMLDAITAEAGWLADGDDVRFTNEVARRRA